MSQDVGQVAGQDDVGDVVDVFDKVAEKVAAAGLYPDLATAQLRILAGGEPVVDHVVLSEMVMNANTGLHTNVEVHLLTPSRLVSWFAFEGPEHVHTDDEDRDPGVDPVPNRPVLRSHTRVTPLSAVIDLRVTMSVFNPGQRQPGHGVPDVVRVDVLTAELGSVGLHAVTCPEDDCGGLDGFSGDVAHEPVTMFQDAAADSAQHVEELLRFTANLSRRIGTR